MKHSTRLSRLVLGAVFFVFIIAGCSSSAYAGSISRQSAKRNKSIVSILGDPSPLLLTGVDSPSFIFNESGTVTIKYQGATYVTLTKNDWYKLYTYTNGDSTFFQCKKVGAGAANGIGGLVKNDKLRNSLKFSPAKGNVELIGNGDLRPTGSGIVIKIPVHNAVAIKDTPTQYVVIKSMNPAATVWITAP